MNPSIHYLNWIVDNAKQAGLLAQMQRTVRNTVPSYLFVLNKDPRLAMIGLRYEIEQKLKLIANSKGLNDADDYHCSIASLLPILEEEGIFTRHQTDTLHHIKKVLNWAAHHNQELHPYTGRWIILVGPPLLTGLDLFLN